MDLDSNKLGLGRKPALVLVDMINGFTDPDCPLGVDCPEVIAANNRLLDAFHSRELPVYFTTVVYYRDDQARVFRDRVPALNLLMPGSMWVQVDPRLDMQESDTLIEKQWASAFHRTELDQQLRKIDVDSLVITGLTTSGCVRATAVDALQYDYRVVLPAEAVADRNPDAHSANLFDLNAKYADVVSLDQALSQLPLVGAV